MSATTSPDLLEGFTVCDPEQPELIGQKIDLLARDGHIVVSDFDLTLTTNEHTDPDVDTSSWGLLRTQLSEHACAADDALYRLFRPRERDDTLSEADSQYWWDATLGLYVRDGININAMRAAAEAVCMRLGAVGFFGACEEEHVPSGVVSAGLYDVIKIVADKYAIHPDAILATRLRSDPVSGKVTGWVKSSVVHPYNKNERGLKTITRLREPTAETCKYAGTLLLGDSTKDPRMVDGSDVLRIRVAEPHPTMSHDAYVAQSRDVGYDLVINDQSLTPVSALVRHIATLRQQYAA